MHKGYLKSDGKSQSITHNKADATAMWIMDAEYYVKSQKKGTIEKVDKSLPDRVGRNYIVTFDKKMKKGGMAKSEAPKGKSIVKKEKKTKEPKIVRGFFDDEPYEYAKGGSSMPNYTKTMNLVKVKFNNPKYNYSTSVSSDVTESEARKYFVGKMFDVGVYPKENMQKAVDIEFFPKGTYSEEMAKGGMTEHGLKKNDKILDGDGNTIAVKNKKESALVDLDKGKRTTLSPKVNFGGGGYMKKGGKTDEKPKTPKGKKMKEKEPQIVRGYFDDEPYEYGDGGAIYVGDKVKIKGSNKTMVVKNISKGKKGYVEFSGDGGTFLKGDIEKYAEGGSMKSKMDDYISSIAKSNKKQFSVNQYHQFRDKKYDFGVSNGFFLDTDDNYSKFDKKLGEALNVNWDGEYEKGGSISSWNYEIGGL